jgi:hypothetical protein
MGGAILSLRGSSAESRGVIGLLKTNHRLPLG